MYLCVCACVCQYNHKLNHEDGIFCVGVILYTLLPVEFGFHIEESRYVTRNVPHRRKKHFKNKISRFMNVITQLVF